MADLGSGPPNLGVGDALRDEDMISDIDPYADFDEIVDPAAVHEDQDMGEDTSSYQMFDASNNLSFDDAHMNVDASTSLASIHEVMNVSANASNHLAVNNFRDDQSDLLEWDEDGDEIDYPPFEEASHHDATSADTSTTVNLTSINNQPLNSDLAEDTHYTDPSLSTEIQDGKGTNASADETTASTEPHLILDSTATQLEHGDEVEDDENDEEQLRSAAGTQNHNDDLFDDDEQLQSAVGDFNRDDQLYDEDEQLDSAVVAASVSAPGQTTHSSHLSDEVKVHHEGNGAVESTLSKDVAQSVQDQSVSNHENNAEDNFHDLYYPDGGLRYRPEHPMHDYAGCAQQISEDFSDTPFEWNVVPTIVCKYKRLEFALFPPLKGVPELEEFENWKCLLNDTQIAFQKLSIFFMHARQALLDLPPHHELVLKVPDLHLEIGEFESTTELDPWYSMRLILHIFHQLHQNDGTDQLLPLRVEVSARPLIEQALASLYNKAKGGLGLSALESASGQPTQPPTHHYDDSHFDDDDDDSGHGVAVPANEGEEPLEDSQAANASAGHEAASSLNVEHHTSNVQLTHEPGTVAHDVEEEIDESHREDGEAHEEEEEDLGEVREGEEDFEDEEEEAVEPHNEDEQVAKTGKEEVGAAQETDQEVDEVREEEEEVGEAQEEEEGDKDTETVGPAATAQVAHSVQDAKDTFAGEPNYSEDEIIDDFYDGPHVASADTGEQHHGGNDSFDADETASSTINQDSGFNNFGVHYNELAVESAFDGIDDINNVDTYEEFGEDRTLGAEDDIDEAAGRVVTSQEDDQEVQVGIMPENYQEPHAEPTDLSSLHDPKGEYVAALTEDNIQQLDRAQSHSQTREDDEDRLSFHSSLDGPWEDFSNADGKVAMSPKDIQENVATDLSALPLDNGTTQELTGSELTRKRSHTDFDDADHVGEEQAEPKRLRLSPEADEDEIV